MSETLARQIPRPTGESESVVLVHYLLLVCVFVRSFHFITFCSAPSFSYHCRYLYISFLYPASSTRLRPAANNMVRRPRSSRRQELPPPAPIPHYGVLPFLRNHHQERLHAIIFSLSTRRLTRNSEGSLLRKHLSQLTVPPRRLLPRRPHHDHVPTRDALSHRTHSSLR